VSQLKAKKPLEEEINTKVDDIVEVPDAFNFQFHGDYPEICMLSAKIHHKSPILVVDIGQKLKKGDVKVLSRAQCKCQCQEEYE
jgi:hypothetical protein